MTANRMIFSLEHSVCVCVCVCVCVSASYARTRGSYRCRPPRRRSRRKYVKILKSGTPVYQKKKKISFFFLATLEKSLYV